MPRPHACRRRAAPPARPTSPGCDRAPREPHAGGGGGGGARETQDAAAGVSRGATAAGRGATLARGGATAASVRVGARCAARRARHAQARHTQAHRQRQRSRRVVVDQHESQPPVRGARRRSRRAARRAARRHARRQRPRAGQFARREQRVPLGLRVAASPAASAAASGATSGLITVGLREQVVEVQPRPRPRPSHGRCSPAPTAPSANVSLTPGEAFAGDAVDLVDAQRRVGGARDRARRARASRRLFSADAPAQQFATLGRYAAASSAGSSGRSAAPVQARAAARTTRGRRRRWRRPGPRSARPGAAARSPRDIAAACGGTAANSSPARAGPCRT